MRFSSLAAPLAALALGACGDDAAPADAGHDAGPPDAGHDGGPPDAGPSYLFGPCGSDTQCPGPNGFCREATMEGWHGGFCTRPCDFPDRGLCDDGIIFNHCVEQEDGSGICEQRCVNGVDCMRTGYTCVGLGAFPGGTGICQPVCSSDGECAPGATCNRESGLCYDPATPPTGNTIGETCDVPEDCLSEQCIEEEGTTGLPTGWIDGACVGPCILPPGYNSNDFYMGTSLPQGTCIAGAVCFPNGSLTQRDPGLCLDECLTDPDCRDGYECRNDFATGSGTYTFDNGVCLPVDCNETPCPTGFSCRTLSTTSGPRYVCERM